MIKVGLIGAGKMGISHLSILGAHPKVEVIGVVDTAQMVTNILDKFSPFDTYYEIDKMLDLKSPDAVFVAVPTKYHADIVEELLLRGIHVFVEKPFCLDTKQGEYLVNMAKRYRLINQVGYHNKFIETFNEAKRIIQNGYIGKMNHFMGEAYGPVITNKDQNSWRSKANEGGGCLMDYASHVIDLINYLVGPIQKIYGAIIKPIFSKNVDDAVYSLLETQNNITGVLSVNWSEETYRKMSTTITINGSEGKLIVDSTELKVYFKNNHCPENYTKGWNIKNINELTKSVDFYLRGEEYTAQVDYFIKSILGEVPNDKNNFESALMTDQVITKIRNNHGENGKNTIWR
jgi:hypothetical protein